MGDLPANLLRRRLLALGAGTLAAVAPRIGTSQRTVKRVGVFGRDTGLYRHWKEHFPKEFQSHGFIEGRNLQLIWYQIPLQIEAPGESGVGEKARHLAAQMMGDDLDCLMTFAEPGTRFLLDATRTIPIITDVPDPIASGFAKTLSRPGGNVTGLHGGAAEVSLKTIELFRRLVPGLSCVAWIGWAGMRDRIKTFEANVQGAGLRSRVISYSATDAGALGMLRSDFSKLRSERCLAAKAEVDTPDFIAAVATLALEHRIALSGFSPETAGVLAMYGIRRLPEHTSTRRLPAIAARILRGERPEDIPFEGPSRYVLHVNLETAARIGITVPPDVLVQADIVTR